MAILYFLYVFLYLILHRLMLPATRVPSLFWKSLLCRHYNHSLLMRFTLFSCNILSLFLWFWRCFFTEERNWSLVLLTSICDWQHIDYLVTVKSRWLSDFRVKVRSFNNDHQLQMCAISWLVNESLLPLYQPNPEAVVSR